MTLKNLKLLLLESLYARAIVVGNCLLEVLLLLGGTTIGTPTPCTNERKRTKCFWSTLHTTNAQEYKRSGGKQWRWNECEHLAHLKPMMGWFVQWQTRLISYFLPLQTNKNTRGTRKQDITTLKRHLKLKIHKQMPRWGGNGCIQNSK